MGVFDRGLVVALDAAALGVAVLARRPGRRRVRGFRRVPLEPGALVPSPAGSNVVRREELREALASALGELSPGGGRATLVLPDGIARLAMLQLPEGAEPRDYMRFRLAASLPWPASDAIVQVLPLDRGRVVGAAVRRTTVAQYEQLAASAGLSIDRVHLAPLVALAALLGRRGRNRRSGVHALLGDVALCLAVIRDGRLEVLRNRRRDPGDGEGARLLAEAVRTARQPGDGDAPMRLALSGSGATRLRETLGSSVAGVGLEGPREWPDAAEATWLAGALA
jgi:hypothetical protein